MDINKALKAIANEKRWQILRWLHKPDEHFTSSHCDVKTDGVCVGLIEKKIGLSQSTVSQYLLQLQQAGFIIMERRGQWTYCRLNKETLRTLSKELEALA